MDDLKRKKCVPCERWMPPLKGEKLAEYVKQVNAEWEVEEEKKLKREFTFKNFVEALQFVNRVGEVAEAEGHHPDICLYSYKYVRVELYTYKIGGLHENDFILAAKIDGLTIQNSS